MPRTKATQHAPWYAQGLRFECTQCGRCCITEGDYSEVAVSAEEAARIAERLDITNEEFANRYCQPSTPLLMLKDAPGGRCIFLTEANQCSVYEARPSQCRTWPFWPENLESERVWRDDVAERCPGIGHGTLHSLAQIQRMLRESGDE